MVLEVEAAPDNSDVVVEETGGAMVGGEGNVGVVDACVEFPLSVGFNKSSSDRVVFDCHNGTLKLPIEDVALIALEYFQPPSPLSGHCLAALCP